MAADLLNEAQKISLAVTLRIIEERLLSLQTLIRCGRQEGVLIHFRMDIEKQKLSDLSDQIEQILRTIDEIKERFALPEKSVRLSDMLRATAAHFETLLIDEISGKLNRYGAVSPALEQELDPLINKLIKQVNLIDLNSERNDSHEQDNQH